MLSMGIGGYMEQWVGMSSTDDAGNKMNDGGMGQKSDSEGSLESDSGLKFAVKFELEGQNNADGTANNIDEARMTIGGSFGEIWLGGDDVASTAMHAGVPDVGIGLGDGDVGKWIVGAANGLSTVGPDLHSDYGHIAYYTPRLSGVQLGGRLPQAGPRPDRKKAAGRPASTSWATLADPALNSRSAILSGAGVHAADGHG